MSENTKFAESGCSLARCRNFIILPGVSRRF
jgi:hypothetical protein